MKFGLGVLYAVLLKKHEFRETRQGDSRVHLSRKLISIQSPFLSTELDEILYIYVKCARNTVEKFLVFANMGTVKAIFYAEA